LPLGFLIGLLPALFFFMVGYMRIKGREPWPLPLIGQMFPFVRSINLISLF
jgi:hypothetical protein